MSFGFKPNPKAQVELKFRELFGREFKCSVTGARDGRTYRTAVAVEGEVIATASHSDWRKSYKMLALEIEKLFSEGVALV
ncbi:MAG: hypothetical protein EBR82_33355 [Caulobacteraceae bacterium]|nr:hypothetical protein [Caulobacteraceae bacterium]